ncbi:DUF3244 domain-containing protein [Bacteroides acidifaciens]|uniref:DUF3244 domain-containing protein n=1 Tax=Bacteroides acidifaciens TaxID=85831 RepID=UPI0025582486|nr:DUF3244 domain-containing protein [Bacteroides acidifaciens]
MKKELLIFVLCSMLVTQLPYLANSGIDTYSTRQTVILRGSEQHSTQRTLFPAQVFLMDHLLTTESLDFESDFKITITNISTGEVVYEQTYNASTKYTTIDLGTEETGEYKIELSSANWQLYGNFSL